MMLGSRVREARERLGLSQEKLAQQITIERNTLWYIEAGRTKHPRADQVAARQALAYAPARQACLNPPVGKLIRPPVAFSRAAGPAVPISPPASAKKTQKQPQRSAFPESSIRAQTQYFPGPSA